MADGQSTETTPMGVAERRQREKKERRCCILDAAERVFLDKGLAAATMDEIAHEAEVSKGTLYLYFESKEELCLAITLRAFRDLVALSDEAVALGTTGAERLDRLVRTQSRYAIEHPDRFRIATSWISSDCSVSDESRQFAEYKALLARLFRETVESIELGKRDETLRPDLDAPQLAVQIWGASFGLLMLQLNTAGVSRRFPKPFDFERLLPSFLDLVLRAIKNDAAARERGP